MNKSTSREKTNKLLGAELSVMHNGTIQRLFYYLKKGMIAA